MRTLEQLPRETKLLKGELDPPVEISMNGLRLEADLLKGQKTGVFLDQRENYLAGAGYTTGRALDCFTSTGGFALHLARTCESVEAVDSSAPALATARRNAAANCLANIEFREADVFEKISGSLCGKPARIGKSGSGRKSVCRIVEACIGRVGDEIRGHMGFGWRSRDGIRGFAANRQIGVGEVRSQGAVARIARARSLSRCRSLLGEQRKQIELPLFPDALDEVGTHLAPRKDRHGSPRR